MPCNCRYMGEGEVMQCASCAKDAELVSLRQLRDRLQARNTELVERNRGLETEAITEYLCRQWDWSKRTFGPGRRTKGIIDHITKELGEIAAKPDDLSEWIDVAILAMDGYWRHGGTPGTFMRDMQAKQDKNFARTWPTPVSEDVAVEHDRSKDGYGSEPTQTHVDLAPVAEVERA